MEINREIKEILIQYKINKDAGLLVLLGIYFKLDVDEVCPEEVIKAINATKIVEKDYRNNIIQWNIPLFEGQQTEWEWVKEWNSGFGRLNPDRKDNDTDVIKRMQEFFMKYPKYRVTDVVRARDMYFATVKDAQYLKSSAKFIFEGMGAKKTSILLTWCERAVGKEAISQQKGRIIT